MADFASSEADKPSETEPVVEIKSSDAPEANNEDTEADGAEEVESTAVFTPKVQLEKVEVTSGEEDEEVLYSQRSKLYIYGESLLDKGSGNKQWNERGIGDIKLLKHKENSRIRVLMRQERTLKVIANHALDPRLELTPNASAVDKSFVWTAWDFAENELLDTTFAVRFKTSEIATEFKDTFIKYQAEMDKLLGGEDDEDGADEADEAADLIAGVSVGDDESSTTTKKEDESPAKPESTDDV